MTTLRQDYQKLINKHYTAVQTDAWLSEMDDDDARIFSLEKRAKQFWTEFHELERDFIAKLEALK